MIALQRRVPHSVVLEIVFARKDPLGGSMRMQDRRAIKKRNRHVTNATVITKLQQPHRHVEWEAGIGLSNICWSIARQEGSSGGITVNVVRRNESNYRIRRVPVRRIYSLIEKGGRFETRASN